jgi:hypothetical protein
MQFAVDAFRWKEKKTLRKILFIDIDLEKSTYEIEEKEK